MPQNTRLSSALSPPRRGASSRCNVLRRRTVETRNGDAGKCSKTTLNSRLTADAQRCI
jgi:hypothetical protein